MYVCAEILEIGVFVDERVEVAVVVEDRVAMPAVRVVAVVGGVGFGFADGDEFGGAAAKRQRKAGNLLCDSALGSRKRSHRYI